MQTDHPSLEEITAMLKDAFLLKESLEEYSKK